MTTEAVFIIPWVLFIFVWLIYTGYFEYDRCLAFQDDYSIAAQTAGQILTADDQQNWLNGHITSSTKNKYMGAGGVNMEGNVNSSEVTMKTTVGVRQAVVLRGGVTPSGSWGISDTVAADNYSFTKRLRTFRMIGRAAN